MYVKYHQKCKEKMALWTNFCWVSKSIHSDSIWGMRNASTRIFLFNQQLLTFFFFFFQAQSLERRTNKFNSFFLPVLYPECPDMLAFLKERRWVTWMKEYKTGRWLRTVEKASDKIQCAYLLLHASHLGEALNIEMEQGIIWNNTVYFIPFPSERVLRIVLSIRTITHHSKLLSLKHFSHAYVDLIPVWHCCVDRST